MEVKGTEGGYIQGNNVEKLKGIPIMFQRYVYISYDQSVILDSYFFQWAGLHVPIFSWISHEISFIGLSL